MIVPRIAAALLGSALVIFTLASAIKTVVVPRALTTNLTRAHFLMFRRLFDLLTPPSRPFAARDRIMALYAPVSLVTLPATWIVLVVTGFTAVFWGTGIDPLTVAFETSGSSLLTLGFLRPQGVGRQMLTFVEAGMGLGLVSLMISYLPSIYAAFSRREMLVGLLEVRAGLPPSPIELLVRYQFIGWLDNIDADLFQKWEGWFADIEESHTSQPSLVFFRSPHPERSWLTAAGCVLDTAAIVASTIDREPTGIPDLIIRAGYLSLRRIADFFQIAYDPDPSPTAPIAIRRDEFDDMYDQLNEAGVPLREREQAWLDFVGWRVNYETVLLELCALAMAPPAMWSSDRMREGHVRPPLRFRRGARDAARPTPTVVSDAAGTSESDDDGHREKIVAGVRPRRINRRR